MVILIKTEAGPFEKNSVILIKTGTISDVETLMNFWGYNKSCFAIKIKEDEYEKFDYEVDNPKDFISYDWWF